MKEHRRLLMVSAGAVALSAVAGAVGLMTGTLSLDAKLVDRLPFGSQTVGGVALLAVVALPFAVLAWLARRWKDADALAAVAGGLLVGWIMVETAALRSFSPLQPLFLLVGIAFIVVGRGAWQIRTPRAPHWTGGSRPKQS